MLLIETPSSIRTEDWRQHLAALEAELRTASEEYRSDIEIAIRDAKRAIARLEIEDRKDLEAELAKQ